MSKPHIYRVNGKWYCKRKYEDAFADWYEFHEGNKLATFGLRGL